MKELYKSICIIVLSLCELMYKIREFIVILLSFFCMFSMSSTETETLSAMSVCSLLMFICCVLRYLHVEYKKAERASKKYNRITHIDVHGNPYIKTEDLPQAVTMLYEIEESGYVIGGRK